MVNWLCDRQELINKTINAIYDELEAVIYAERYITANYWIDGKHNVFAENCDDNGGDEWIEIHYELYDINEELVGDIDVLLTEDRTPESLRKCIIDIVDEYYYEFY